MSVAELLRAPPADLPERVAKLLDERKAQEREIERLQSGQSTGAVDPAADSKDIGGVRVIASRVDGVGGKALRTMVDELRGKLGSGIVLIASVKEGRATLALGVTKDLTGRFKAGDLVREVAVVVGGKGGGRPDFAQAGGDDVSKLDLAFERFEALVAGG